MISREVELFKKFALKHPNLIRDGLVSKEHYIKSTLKVLYVLKEVNGGSNWDLRQLLREGKRKQTWNTLALWHFGIQNFKVDFDWAELSKKRTDDFRKAQLREIVAMNLKKEAGGSVANESKLWRYADQDKELLKEQFSIYEPNIVICCGNPVGSIVRLVEIANEEFVWSESKVGVRYAKLKDNRLIIDYCHPEARINDNFKFYPLIKTIREVY